MSMMYYFRSERHEMNGVLVALAMFAVQYLLFYAVSLNPTIRVERLLPTILIFLIAIALVIVIRVGLRARSRAGTRLALAGMFTLAGYLCIGVKPFLAH
jgi:hypothetical protein